MTDEIPKGNLSIDRRCAWRIRLLEQETAGLSAKEQHMEKVLMNAKSQLKRSERQRTGHGDEKEDEDDLDAVPVSPVAAAAAVKKGQLAGIESIGSADF